MNREVLPPLDRTPILESNNYEEADMMLAQLIAPFKSERLNPRERFFTRYYHAQLAQASMVYLQWQGSQKLLRTQPDDLYILYLPLEGLIQEKIDNREVIPSSVTTAHIFTPQQTLMGQIGYQGQGISVCIPRNVLEKELGNLLNHAVNPLLTFSPEIDLTTVFGRSLKELIIFSWQATAQGSLFLPQLEQNLITGLLTHQCHSYRSRLRNTDRKSGDRLVKLAKEFMLANLQQPISLGDIAAAISVSGRSLQRAFAKYEDCSPIQFLMNARLDALHQELINPNSPLSITDLMNKYQCVHWGRCSQRYRERFGALPSETYQRSF
jgi:AraC-like DNA-binding protein